VSLRVAFQEHYDGVRCFIWNNRENFLESVRSDGDIMLEVLVYFINSCIKPGGNVVSTGAGIYFLIQGTLGYFMYTGRNL
jgi:hypothetical protein